MSVSIAKSPRIPNAAAMAILVTGPRNGVGRDFVKMAAVSDVPAAAPASEATWELAGTTPS